MRSAGWRSRHLRDTLSSHIALEPDAKYLVNPGSVGQPRDGDSRAAYAIVDDDRKVVTLYRVAYPIEIAQKKILDAGLPPPLAYRLAMGR